MARSIRIELAGAFYHAGIPKGVRVHKSNSETRNIPGLLKVRLRGTRRPAGGTPTLPGNHCSRCARLRRLLTRIIAIYVSRKPAAIGRRAARMAVWRSQP